MLLPVFALSGTGTSKCGTGTKRVFLGFAWLVSVPVRVVQVPLSLFFFLKQQCQYIEIFRMPSISDPTGCSFLSLLHTSSNLTCVHGTKKKNVLHSLDTFTLTLGSTILLVITIPKVQTELVIQGSRWVQRVTQDDFEM